MFALSDAELIRTAGLDALIFHRAFTFGIQFFGPVTILACVLCAFPNPNTHDLHVRLQMQS